MRGRQAQNFTGEPKEQETMV
ncbi:hypothetical protein GQ600_1368 [Phytophthora cactorum]|nr:hypothetical protein GQ600_1368 [Phytophthora cactorum]